MARWLVGGVLGLALVLACGSERPPAEGSGMVTPGKSGGGGGGFATDGGSQPPGCGVNPDGTQCDCLDAPLYVDAPTLYFVLDRSESMKAGDAWNRVRVTVGEIMRGLGPRANFGAATFPGPSADNVCTPGVEVMSVRPGDPPSSSADGPTTTLLLSATRVVPGGGTPTGPTLEVARSRLANVAGRKFVILATDGAPNCNENAVCGYDECELNLQGYPNCPREGPRNCCEGPGAVNCTDRTATLAAISSLRTAGIPTYVIGLPGVARSATLLDEMATTGGTALPTSPKYFAVNSASEDLILAQLKKIAAQIAGTCTFALKEAPADPNLVNVYIDDVVLPYDPATAWAIDGKTVTLLGSTCDRVKSGDVLSVRIIVGCARVGPR